MFNKRSLILLSTLIPLLVVIALLSALRPPVAMAAPSATTMMVDKSNQICTTPIVVTSTLSSGAGTLRQAISDVCHDGLITFDSPLRDQTIDISAGGLITGELIISKSVTISGSVPITISGGNAVRVFNVMTGTPPVNVTFDGVVIANGRDQSTEQTTGCESFTEFCGSGMIIQNSNAIVTVTNSTFVSNTAYIGSGILNRYGTLIVNNSTFTSNTSSGGSALFNDNGTITITASALLNNVATDLGGAILNYQGVLAIEDSILSGNTATYGGGIFNQESLLTITNSSVSENRAFYHHGDDIYDGEGGGIFNDYDGTVTIYNSSLFNNYAVHGGGLLNYNTASIHDSTLSGNTSLGNGGGIRNSNGILTVTNSTLAYNVTISNSGGSIANSGVLFLANSTVSNNSVTIGYGGGLYNQGTFHLKNTIIANTLNGDDCYSTVGLTTDVHNLIEANNGCGIPVSTDDPLLGTLQDNGGATLTHALLPDSPAINAGDPTYPVQSGDYDQRGEGFDRVINGRLDIGAYELQDITAVFLPIIIK